MPDFFACLRGQRQGRKWLVVVTALPVLLAGLPARSAPPNVVLIVADDLGWGDLSHNGNTNLHTPALDQLSAEGATFKRFYVQPVCAPTRAELLTGCYHPRVGVSGVSEGLERLNATRPTIADRFRAAGYATAAFGKWHNGTQAPHHPLCRGFDEFYGFTSGHWGHYYDFWLDHNGELEKGNGYAADDFTDHAIDWIDTQHTKPFLLLLAFNTPHSPMQVPDRWWASHAAQELVGRATEPSKEDFPHTRAALAMCENLDHNVGRLLEHVKTLGLEEQTIIVFLSDNGPNGHRWNDGLKGIKGSVEEGGVRSPLLVRWTGKIPPGRVVSTNSAAIDLTPTLTQLADIPLPDVTELDGISLADELLDQTAALNASLPVGTDRILYSHWAGRIAARSGGYLRDERGRLYDLRIDPIQQHNVAQQHPAISARLSAAVNAWRTRMEIDRSHEAVPFLVGRPGLPITPLPARDAVGTGHVRRSNRYPNCSYFSGWRSPEDRVVWHVDVEQAGRYEATLFAAIPAASVGDRLTLHTPTGKATVTLTQATDTRPLGAAADRTPRQEGDVLDFHPFRLGVVPLQRGPQSLSLGVTPVKTTAVRDHEGPAVWHLSLRRMAADEKP
ncbi:arylsulfatase [Botrimarina hoheduenensis]|uniref:Arylsulfatase n=1 Tax=Botrimarina hoheduenensis TaxID=2528000 RepID=A0A5C5VR60_9BACT|nr:arylsulfatase [Botrimarina hoheduenensis]TWT40169.1 Arylsulfatase precursor [Botrimarina hoheduenensis]